MADYIQIKDLTEAEGVSDNDVFLIDDGTNIEKKATVKKVKDNILKLSQEEGNGLEMKADGLYAGGSGKGSALVPSITQNAYNDLTEEEKLNGQIREITDAQGFPVPFAILNDELETSSNVLSAQKVKTEINNAKEELKELVGEENGIMYRKSPNGILELWGGTTRNTFVNFPTSFIDTNYRALLTAAGEATNIDRQLATELKTVNSVFMYADADCHIDFYIIGKWK